MSDVPKPPPVKAQPQLHRGGAPVDEVERLIVECDEARAIIQQIKDLPVHYVETSLSYDGGSKKWLTVEFIDKKAVDTILKGKIND